MGDNGAFDASGSKPDVERVPKAKAGASSGIQLDSVKRHTYGTKG